MVIVGGSGGSRRGYRTGPRMQSGQHNGVRGSTLGARTPPRVRIKRGEGAEQTLGPFRGRILPNGKFSANPKPVEEKTTNVAKPAKKPQPNPLDQVQTVRIRKGDNLFDPRSGRTFKGRKK